MEAVPTISERSQTSVEDTGRTKTIRALSHSQKKFLVGFGGFCILMIELFAVLYTIRVLLT